MSRYCGHILRAVDHAPLVSTLADEDGKHGAVVIHPAGQNNIHLPNEKIMFATIGFDDAKRLPRCTMAAVIAELRASLGQAWTAAPSADAIVMLEVPSNMTKADIDALCGANAERIIVRRTDYQVDDSIAAFVGFKQKTMDAVISELRAGLAQVMLTNSDKAVVLEVPKNMDQVVIDLICRPYSGTNILISRTPHVL